MNDHLFRNVLKVVVSYALYYAGILHILTRLFVRRGLWIFNYHGFNTFTNDYWDFGSLYTSGYGWNFEKQVGYFEKNLHKLTDFNLAGAAATGPAYFLTLDDGYRDNFEIALPVLVRHAIPSIFFIATGAIGTDRLLWHDSVRRRYESKSPGSRRDAARLKRRCKDELERLKGLAGKAGQWMMRVSPEASPRLMMNWDEVLSAAAAGVLIGAHTNTHPILSRLSSDSQREEIQTSIETIKRKTGQSPEFFSYTGGDAKSFNEETVRILKDLGIRFAVTTEEGINGSADAAPYLLKRMGMNPSDPVPVVALKIALVGLKTKLDLQKLKKWKVRAGLALRQYGFWNAMKRAFKAALRPVGIQIEKHFILQRDLNAPIDMSNPPAGIAVKELSYDDFETSFFFNEFSPDKRGLLKRRFSSPDYQAFGAVREGELVYMTWIATDFLRIEAIHFEQKLGPNEGVLLDSMTSPEARGLGIHSFMNMYRLARLRERGVRQVYVAILAENRPALKSQIKSGFRHGERIVWLRLGGSGRYFRKDASFPPPTEIAAAR